MTQRGISMKRSVKEIDYFQRIIDLIFVFGSWLIAYALRFIFEIGGNANDKLFNWYLGFGLVLVIISSIVFKNSKIYDSTRFANLSKEIASQIKGNVIAFAAFLIVSFFVSEYRVSRIMLAFYFTLSTAGLVLSKVYFRNLRSKIKQNILLIGSGKAIQKYKENIQTFSNIVIIGEVTDENQIKYDELESMDLTNIVIGFNQDESDKASAILTRLSELIIPLVVLPDISFSKIGHRISEFKGQPLIYLNEPNVKQSGLIFKRVFDFMATAIGLIFISPILLVIALIVKFTSRGPIFYNQIRMGVDGREFKMWKFRSMVIGEENHGGWTVENDPRVTKIGRILRKTNLDELPQLWNVITGDMSLVGPRPERPMFVEQFRKEIPGYMIRHKFKAGVTGWAQVNGWRGDTSIEKRIECDLWYIRNWSFWLDITILFMTFFKGNKNAY